MAEFERRHLLAGLAALGVGACSRVGESETASSIFDTAESWHREAHRALAGRQRLAPEFDRSQVSPSFRGNGSLTVDTPEYRAELANGFPNWRLAVTGLVDRPLNLSIETLRALPQRVQVTRHDCVEGWSAIGEWTGPQLSTILDAAGVRPEANFVVFRCADTLYGRRYYESVDMVDAYHPQTIIAHQLNGENLPEKNGAPLRMRIERQLGYKHAKYLTGIEAVASLDDVGEGKGGFWEDVADYQWYAGI
ncbi:molybdopterin-dependent oxidoreductase [Erythrobacter sp.]|jgi:DMSO/TMAO reductase YedYZ molybdopterin-dependent catalytic subunit|uniref:molybdopterin-dependent oxidoreductase n=1 Tax=Erythrobacter sp. TaxID=1042 RepID=UPI002EAA7B52|nr:molybdopterin-dependent oxidoreductase [Erythrobacter sp.]